MRHARQTIERPFASCTFHFEEKIHFSLVNRRVEIKTNNKRWYTAFPSTGTSVAKSYFARVNTSSVPRKRRAKKLVKNFPKPDTFTARWNRNVDFVWQSAESRSSIIKSFKTATFSAAIESFSSKIFRTPLQL